MPIRIINDGPMAVEGESHLVELIAAGAPPPVASLTLTQPMINAGTFLVIIRDNVLITGAFNKDPVIPVASAGAAGTPGNMVFTKGFFEVDIQGKIGDTFRLRLEAGGLVNITVIVNPFTDVPASGRRSSGGL